MLLFLMIQILSVTEQKYYWEIFPFPILEMQLMLKDLQVIRSTKVWIWTGTGWFSWQSSWAVIFVPMEFLGLEKKQLCSFLRVNDCAQHPKCNVNKNSQFFSSNHSDIQRQIWQSCAAMMTWLELQLITLVTWICLHFSFLIKF